MVESTAATPQATQVDMPETAIGANEAVGNAGANSVDKDGSPMETAVNGESLGLTKDDADKGNEMDIDEDIKPVEDQTKVALRRSPSVDMITSPAPNGLIQPEAEEDADSLIERILGASNAPLVDGKKYCVVDVKWWKRFLAQASDYEPTKEDNFDLKEPVPRLDTSGLIDHIEALPNGNTFPILKDGLGLMQDFEIIPLETWDELARKYGVNEKSPPLIRYAIDTAARGSNQENILVDLYPPVYTVYLLSPSAPTNFAQLKDSAQRQGPSKIKTGKDANFQEFLVDIKALLGLESRDKIRLWKFAESATVKAPRSGKLDINTFLQFDYGANREVINLPDNTKQVLLGEYNGTMTLVEAGISQEKYLIVEVEEEGEWPSDRVGKALKLNGADPMPVRVTKGTQVTTSISSAKAVNNSKAKAVATRSTTTVAATAPKNVMTRRDGRAPGAVGFSNLGNTCYMNSALQCLKSVEELSRYFVEKHYQKELNIKNPIGSKGKIATVYGQLMQQVYSSNASSSVAPREFKLAVGRHNGIFSGYGQQDSQEFVSYLLDILHEDVNRIHDKPSFEYPDSTDEMINDPEAIAKLAEENWSLYKQRNDSAIIDLFAGMYKSTVTCPVCDKTSIKFDPWLSCQLQLPIENMWSKAVTFVPSAHSSSPYRQMVTIHVEMDKHATIKQLKDFVKTRLGVESKKMVVSEVFRNKFYKHHEDTKSVSEAIMPNDQIFVYEVEEIPSNFPPPKRKKPMTRGYGYTMATMFSTWEDEESEDDLEKTETRELLVPVFNRLYKNDRRLNADLFGIPSFIVLNREEQKDPKKVLEKVIQNLQKFTTSNMHSPDFSPMGAGEQQGQSSAAESDSLEEEGEVVDIPPSRNETESEGGPEDFVDVKMGDAESELNVDMATTPAVPPQDEVSEELLRSWSQLFTLKVLPRKGQVVLPTGWNGIEFNLELMSTRIVKVPEPAETEGEDTKKPNGGKYLQSPPASDESDADAEAEPDNTGISDMVDSDDDLPITTLKEKPKNTFSTVSASNFYGNGTSAAAAAAKLKAKKPLSKNAGKQPAAAEVTQGPLVKLGEAIVCDWNQEAYDAIFGGKSGDSFRGISYFTAVEEFFDEELLKKRKAREARRRRGIHIEDCFDEFGREEILNDENQWYCPRCKEHRNAKKSMQIWRVPDIIAIQFKRFSSTRSFRDKIDAAIEFPIEGLDLTGRVLHPDGKSLTYDLIAVDNHFGGLGGGHYTANARNWVDNKWYYFDDSSARTTPATSINGSAAYLVFYRRRTSGILGGEKMEGLLEKSMSEALEDQGSPNGSGSPNGDPAFSGSRYSSGYQPASSSLLYSGDGQRGGVGGSTSLTKLQSTAESRGAASASSFTGQTTPPPEKEKSFQITPDDGNGYYSTNPTRPPLSSTTLFGSTGAGPSSKPDFGGANLGAHHDFGGVKTYTSFNSVGMDEGLEADDDDDVDLPAMDSPGGRFHDSDDDEDVYGLIGPTHIPSIIPPYYDYDDSDSNIPGTGKFSLAPEFKIISRDSIHVVRYEQIRTELGSVLEQGTFVMTLVTRKTTVNKPCVLIITKQQDVEEELTALCNGVGLEIEIIEGEPTFNYDLPETHDRPHNNDLGTLIGPADAPGRFASIGLYVRDKATKEVYALTTATPFAQRDPESELNIPPRHFTALLPEGSIVTQPPTSKGDNVNMANAFGTLTDMYELDICEVGDDESSMLNYALIKVNPDRLGQNTVTTRGVTRPVVTAISMDDVDSTAKITIALPGGTAKDSRYCSVITDVHDMARFPGRLFRMYALFSENKTLSTPGMSGSLCSSPYSIGYAASGIICGRAERIGYSNGSALHFVQPIEWIFEKVREKFNVELELFD
ncbi:hypothetical protein ABW19_dt0210331 [Dactylella cylindrospora]|nr:hypothetical protein ABW19_dt0210331 [Dactylella cylindrospora]